MLDGVEVLFHSSIRIEKDKVIYIDPYNIEGDRNDADLIFITHAHYDHFSLEDILKVKKEDTKIVLPKSMEMESLPFLKEQEFFVKPNQTLNLDGIDVLAIPAYNVNKSFHPKENEWVGYILSIQGISYYIAGDTDINEENQKVKCDVAFLPIGGTYTMNVSEALELTRTLMPKVVVPIHYGSIVGSREDAIRFKQLLNDEIDCVILMK